MKNFNYQFEDYNLFFTQITPLINDIRRNEKFKEIQLQNENILNFIPQQSNVQKLFAQIQDLLKNESPQRKFDLYLILRKTSGRIVITSFALAFSNRMISLVSVMILDQVTDILNSINQNQSLDEDESKSHRISLVLYISLLIITFFSKTLILNQNNWLINLWVIYSQSISQYLLFQKVNLTLAITSDGKQTDDTKKEQDKKPEQSLDVFNLMTTDTFNVTFFLIGLNETVVNSIYTILIIYLLYIKLGTLVLNGLYIVLIVLILNGVIAYLMTSLYGNIMGFQDQRISTTTDVIQGIQSIKFLSWEKIFQKKIENLRKPEFNILAKAKLLQGCQNLTGGCMSYLFLYYFLTTFVEKQNHSLKETNVFTIIALVNLLNYPLVELPWDLGRLLRSRMHFQRIKEYLGYREIQSVKRTMLSSFVSESLISSKGSQISPFAIQIKESQFTWPHALSREDANKEQNKQNQTKPKNENESLKQNLLSFESQISLDSNLGQEQDEFILKIDSLEIQQGSLNFVIGPLGGGKSALLKAILNQLETSKLRNGEVLKSDSSLSYISDSVNQLDKGMKVNKLLPTGSQQINIEGTVGYVSQNHWLQNQTIKDNILFGQEYNEKLYNECLTFSELDQDLNDFPKRDLKVISFGGNNLSGGQRQRIALCRALYQQSDIYLFDDIFSSLDAHVADAIYEKGIREYLIKKRKATVLLVTSHYQFLKNFDLEHIIYIESGKIIRNVTEIQKFLEQGKNKEIQEEKKSYERDLNSFKDQEQSKLSTASLSSDDDTDGDSTQQDQRVKNIIKNDSQITKKTSGKRADKKDQNEEGEQEEQRDKGQLKFQTIITYIQAMTVLIFTLYFVFNLIMRGSRCFIDFWLISQVSTEQSSIFKQMDEAFGDFGDTFLFLLLLNLGITLIRALLFVSSATISAKNIFTRLNRHIIFGKMKFFDQNPPGRIITRISKDIDTIDDHLSWLLNRLLWDFADILILPIALIIQFPAITAVIIIAGLLIYLVQRKFRPANRQLKRLKEINDAKVITHLNETCSGVVTIRAFNKQSFMLAEFNDRMRDSIHSSVASYCCGCWSQCYLMLAGNFIVFSAGLLCIVFVYSGIDIESSSIAMTITYTLLMSDIFYEFIWDLAVIQQKFVSVERIRQYLDNEIEGLEIQRGSKARTRTQSEYQKSQLGVEMPSNSADIFGTPAIEFKNLSFSYQEETDKNKVISQKSIDDQSQWMTSRHMALQNINLKIRKGEKIAFCGRTGSGKTSILNVVFNLYPIQYGELLINGSQHRNMSLQQMRTQMSIIPQFGFLYRASLKENLDPEGQIDRKIIENVYQQVGLSIDKSGKDHEKSEQLDISIENGGENLSNGEKQIINFLRIILRETQIICIDEATSNMDPNTDAKLHEKLFQFAQGKTLLVITHRLQNIDQFDRVIVMEKGEIVQQGPVHVLRKNQGGYFNRLLKDTQA